MNKILIVDAYDPVICRSCIYDEDLVHCKWLLSDNLYGRFFVL